MADPVNIVVSTQRLPPKLKKGMTIGLTLSNRIKLLPLMHNLEANFTFLNFR